MKYRRGVFIVVYYIDAEKQLQYLLLKRKLHWTGWEFPKGGVEDKESIINAVHREFKEETGLTATATKKFNFSGKYPYDKNYADRNSFKGQTFEALYAVEVKSSQKDKVQISDKEHSSYKWVDYPTAQKTLTWQNQKDSLQLVQEYLIGKDYTGFRKSMTSSGKLLLAGKTEANNEELIKKVVKPEDIVLHTIARGSPFVVIKSKDKPTNKDLREAATLCAKHSHDWRDNKKDVLVHYFKGKDIYKKPSMKTGTFGVKNTKEILVKKEWLK